jgi:hypothetical protein
MSPQDKSKLIKAVKELKQLLHDENKRHSNILGKLDSHTSHRKLVMESHQKTKTATNTHPPTKN